MYFSSILYLREEITMSNEKEMLPEVLKDIKRILTKYHHVKSNGEKYTDDEFYTLEICKAFWELYEEFDPL
jgi:hypothetical protein